MTPIEERILLLLRESDRRYTEIATEVGHPKKVVWEALSRLQAEKRVELRRRGVYGITQRGVALLKGVPYALYKLQLEVRIGGSCFNQHIGFVRRGAALTPTAYAVDSFSITSLIDALETFLHKVADSLRIELIDLPRAWRCDFGPMTTMDQYFTHLEAHLANIKRLSAALRDGGPELKRTAEVSEEFVRKAETTMHGLKEGWQNRAFDNIKSS
jgi:hypothetical protein